jgi:hypothetical protein
MPAPEPNSPLTAPAIIPIIAIIIFAIIPPYRVSIAAISPRDVAKNISAIKKAIIRAKSFLLSDIFILPSFLIYMHYIIILNIVFQD